MKHFVTRLCFSLILLTNYCTYLFSYSLSSINAKSSSVLPFFYNQKGEKYAILTREAAGRAKGKYDDFGGKVEEYDNHPLDTASREFWEEAILKDTVHLTLQETADYIDINTSNNTEEIMVYLAPETIANVTYITDFTDHYKSLLNNFYQSRKEQTKWRFKEKDRIAIVQWDTLECAITSQTNKYHPVIVPATVISPRSGKRYKKNITLRDFFVIKTKPFFCNEEYENGSNNDEEEPDEKIKVYKLLTNKVSS